jgi:protein-S-isoprenylcysteine O-methyltransferase Ste14
MTPTPRPVPRPELRPARPLHRPLQAAIQAVVWTGALVFVASLLWFLYCYLVRFGSNPGSGPVGSAIAADVLLFSIFALHHSAFARSGIKERLANAVTPVIERSLYTWTASVLFIAVCTWWQPVPGVLYQIEGGGRFLFYGLQLAAILLIGRASGALGVLNLAGVQPAFEDGQPDRQRPVSLETGGLYGIVRHPIYAGWALFVFSTPVMTGTHAVFAVVSTAYLALAIPFEERSLRNTFGSDYEAYSRKVTWRMVPGLY